MIDAMIFSRNRPMQLHCLLSSIKKYTNLEPKNIHVLHRYDDKYVEGLELLKKLHTNVNFIQEVDFEKQVKFYLKSGSRFCTFFVDDMIVKDEVNFNIPCNILEQNPSVLTFSLRLGTHLTHCYPVNSYQIVPDGNINSSLQVFMWNYRTGHLDWGYPFSVDAHIFRREQLSTWSLNLSYRNPNKFEEALQTIQHNCVIPDVCCCYINSKVVNIPANRVQNEIMNRNEEGSVEEAYESWISGDEMNFESLRGVLNSSVHQVFQIPIRNVEKP